MTTPLTITPGKLYRTRDGNKVGIYATDGGGDYPVHGHVEGTVRSWTAEGWFSNTHSIHFLDLIAEWIDEPQGSWDGYPAWANWRAKDEDGSWWWYEQRPMLFKRDGNWCREKLAQLSGQIPSSHAPTFSGGWTDSLQQRPEETK